MTGSLKVLGFIFCLFSFNIVRGQAKLTLTLKPPIVRELFVNNKVVLEAVVSGDEEKTVQEASVLCTVKNEPVSSVTGNINFSQDNSQFIRIHNISVDAVRHPFRKVNSQTPTLSLVLVTTQKSTQVMCVIEDFYPKNLTVQWKVNDINSPKQSKLEYELNDEGHYTAYSRYKVSGETWDESTHYTCEVTHQGKLISVNFNTKLTLTLKPPIVRELFVNNKVVLEAVVSGDEQKTVQEASVLCTVKNEPVSSVTGNINFSQDISQFIRIHNITIDTKTWFDGEMVTCSIRNTNNNRDIKKEINFDKGDGQTPSVVIYRPDMIYTDTVSLVCEVTGSKLGDVHIMWKVGEQPYIEALTSAHIHQKNSMSVLSILTVKKEEYEDPRTTFTCAVKHANMGDRRPPLQVTTIKPKQPECPVSFDY